MKIAIVSPTIPPLSKQVGVFGGAETYAFSLSREIAKKGNDVTVFSRSGKENTLLKLNDNLTIQYMKSTKGSDVTYVSLELLKKILVSNYDVIHVHQPLTVNNILAEILAKTKRVPLVVTDHGGAWLPLATIPFITRQIPDFFASVSLFSLKSSLKYAPQKDFAILYGGVNTDFFHPTKTLSDVNQKSPFNGYRVILTIGRITRVKGIEVLIRSLPYLPKDIKLVIAGQVHDFEYYAYLRALATKISPERIIFTGLISENELNHLLNLCDVYVQPSLYNDFLGAYHRMPELLGLARLEAMACEKPVVVSKVGGLSELIVDGWNGLCVEPSNERALADKISILLTDASFREKIGKNALSTIKNQCTWSVVAERAINCYKKVCH